MRPHDARPDTGRLLLVGRAKRSFRTTLFIATGDIAEQWTTWTDTTLLAPLDVQDFAKAGWSRSAAPSSANFFAASRYMRSARSRSAAEGSCMGPVSPGDGSAASAPGSALAGVTLLFLMWFKLSELRFKPNLCDRPLFLRTRLADSDRRPLPFHGKTIH